MTTTTDPAVEMAFEAALAGRSVPAGTAGLAAFTQAVRATATQPGRPDAALAELLANGLIVDRPAPCPRNARRGRRPAWFISAVAKIASTGAVARAAAGAAIVLAGFTGTGAAGLLPAGAQHTFAHLVGAATPLHAPDRPQTSTMSAAPSGTSKQTGTASSAVALADGSQGATSASTDGKPEGYDCDPTKSFGSCLSRHAQVGPLGPGQVDAWAHYYQAHRADRQQQMNQTRTQDDAGANEPDGENSGSAKSSVDGSTGQQSGSAHVDSPRGTAPPQGHR